MYSIIVWFTNWTVKSCQVFNKDVAKAAIKRHRLDPNVAMVQLRTPDHMLITYDRETTHYEFWKGGACA